MSPGRPPNAGNRLLLRLYVAGGAPTSRRASEACRRLVDLIEEEIDFEIVDVLAHPDEAENAGILATPTLSDESIKPPRRLIGDINDVAEVLAFFGFRRKDAGL